MELQLPHPSVAGAASNGILSGRVCIPRDTDLEPRRCHRTVMQGIASGIGLIGKDVDNVLEDYGNFLQRGRTSRKSLANSSPSSCTSDPHGRLLRIKYKRIPHIGKDERQAVSFLNRKCHGSLAVLKEDRLSEAELPLARKSMQEAGVASEDFELLSIEFEQSPKRSLERVCPEVSPEVPYKMNTLSGSDWRAEFDKTADERLGRRHKTQSIRDDSQSQDGFGRQVSDPGPVSTSLHPSSDYVNEGAMPSSPKSARSADHEPWGSKCKISRGESQARVQVPSSIVAVQCGIA